jgi:uncharacterized protein YndB with AHSA1/START domain
MNIQIDKDLDQRTMRIATELDATVERAWQLWADPRQLERWWGPPGYPATFEDHELVAGGKATYFMTSPEGERYRGWWRVIAVDAPTRLEVEDGFADASGAPNPEMPTSIMVMELEAIGDARTRMVMVTTWPTREAMERTIEMGVEEGLEAAMGQIPAVLAG